MFSMKNSCDGFYKDSLDVRFTKACDNACPFCIEKCGIDSLGKTNVDEMVNKTLESGKKEILILGGEPLLFPNEVAKYITKIRPHVEKIFITTSVPKTLHPNNAIIAYIMDSIDGLNVSLQHYDSDLNNSLLVASNKHNRLEVLRLLNVRWASKIRVSVNLVSGYVDSKEELENFFSKMSDLGCEHIKINELQHVSAQEHVSFENICDIKMKSAYAFGCQTDITDKKYFNNHSIKTTLKRSCFIVQDSSIAQASFFDVLKALYKRIIKVKSNCTVLYENGTLSNGWKTK